MENIKIDEKYIINRFKVGPIDTNCYIIIKKGEKKALVIDPGFFSKEIIDFLENNNIEVKTVALTHGHFDHIMGVHMFENSNVYIEKEDEELTKDCKKNAGFSINIKKLNPIKNLITIKDNDEIDFFEDKLKLIHTPGHTKGSCCYEFINKIIFTGDTIFKNGVGRCDLYGGNFSELKNSIKKIKALEKNYILLPGHGEKTTVEYEKKFNIYF